MWSEFPQFAPVLDKVSAKWYRKLGGRYDFDELRNECVIVYAEIVPNAIEKRMQRSDICRLLWVCCHNRIVDILRKTKITISIELVQVRADSGEFEALYLKYWFKYVEKLMTRDAKDVLFTVIDKPEELDRVHQVRTSRCKYRTRMSREDLNYLFIRERNWSWGRLNDAVDEVKLALSLRY